jgi:parallel beta-helix repeat protein
MQCSVRPKLVVISAMAANLNVDNTNPACDDTGGIPFCTISAALEQADPGDIVNVTDGIYFESIGIDKDNLTVKGSGHPTIDGGGASTVVSIDANGVSFKGFEVANGIIGINIGGSQNKVKRNWVHDAFTGIHIGVGFDSSETFHVVAHNRVYNIKGSGIEVVSSKNTIRRNLSRKNIGGVGIIVALSSNDNILTNNRASKNTFGGFGIGGSRNKVINNVAKKNGGNGFGAGGGQDNEFVGNTANENQQYGFVDLTTGDGTQGTANFYTNNSCENNAGGSLPSGLCGPQP